MGTEVTNIMHIKEDTRAEVIKITVTAHTAMGYVTIEHPIDNVILNVGDSTDLNWTWRGADKHVYVKQT